LAWTFLNFLAQYCVFPLKYLKIKNTFKNAINSLFYFFLNRYPNPHWEGFNSTWVPNLANAAALAISAANQAATNAAVASNVAASVASVSGGTSSVTTGANQTSTGWTSDMPDYSGVDSTTSPDFSRPNDLGSSLGDSDQVNISSGK